MKKPSYAHLSVDHLIEHQMVFDPVATATGKPIISSLAKQGIACQQHEALLKLRPIAIHLRDAPSLKGILENIG
jgi:hypothetical protein